jgi:type II secretory pathway pseudopilin PulG
MPTAPNRRRTALRPAGPARSARRALTFVELLVAMAVAGVFFLSVLMAFSQILRAGEQAEAQVAANNQARAALLYLARDIEQVRRDTSTPMQFFLLENRSFSYGDGRDNDGDGVVDEEIVDGRDNDGDWTINHDRHARLGPYRERPEFVGIPDLGDLKVDEDCKFGNDRLTLRIPPDPLGADTRNDKIVYQIGSYEGQEHVLLRTVITDPDDPNSESITEPLAFHVLAFDILVWNCNADAEDAAGRPFPYWTSEWDARTRIFPFSKPHNAPDGVPPFEFPASVRAQITIYSGRLPLPSIGWTPGEPIETLTMTTTINLEVTLKDLRYERFIR